MDSGTNEPRSQLDSLEKSFKRINKKYSNNSNWLEEEYECMVEAKKHGMSSTDYRHLREIHQKCSDKKFWASIQRWMKKIVIKRKQKEKLKRKVSYATNKNFWASIQRWMKKRFTMVKVIYKALLSTPAFIHSLLELVCLFFTNRAVRAVVFTKCWKSATLIVVVAPFLWGAIKYLWEADNRERQLSFNAWSVINTAFGKEHNGGRRQALEYLHETKESLVGLTAPRANLNTVKLKGANLTDSTLCVVSFVNAQLQKVDFRGADLRDASFTEANLKEAEFVEANLSGTDFRKATNLTSQQVKYAKSETWKLAIYDEELSEELGISKKEREARIDNIEKRNANSDSTKSKLCSSPGN
jgi:BTB/POZ domain-containing protein KCTD9